MKVLHWTIALASGVLIACGSGSSANVAVDGSTDATLSAGH